MKTKNVILALTMVLSAATAHAADTENGFTAQAAQRIEKANQASSQALALPDLEVASSLMGQEITDNNQILRGFTNLSATQNKAMGSMYQAQVLGVFLEEHYKQLPFYMVGEKYQTLRGILTAKTVIIASQRAIMQNP